MSAPDSETVREIAQEIILKQAKYWNAAEIRQDYRADPRCARLNDEDFVDLRDAVINAVADATVTVSWPDEQPQDERDADVRPGHGPGVPGAMHLEAFGQSIADAFGDCPYHVGSSATSKNWRDVDVRLILDDDRFHALFPGFKAANHIDAFWSLLCAALSELGRARTGLPIDFQIQAQTEANEKYSGIRNPLFLVRAKDEHRPVMVEQDARDTKGGQ